MKMIWLEDAPSFECRRSVKKSIRNLDGNVFHIIFLLLCQFNLKINRIRMNKCFRNGAIERKILPSRYDYISFSNLNRYNFTFNRKRSTPILRRFIFAKNLGHIINSYTNYQHRELFSSIINTLTLWASTHFENPGIMRI